MANYIFSSCLGTFVSDKNGKIIDKSLFKEPETGRNTLAISDKEILKNEKDFLKKYSGKLTFLQEKEDKEIKSEKNPELINKLLSDFNSSEYFKKFYEANLNLTKQKLRDSVSDDLLIINTINNIEDTDRIANSMTKRLREWYSLYFPELSLNMDDNEVYAMLVLTKTRKDLKKEFNIEDSVGSDFSEQDLKPIRELASEIRSLFELRKKYHDYLDNLMSKLCPNLAAITGSLIGAKLIHLAGSLKKMVEMPASTIQLLGAEKALFRHMRTHAKPPKHGIILQHPLLAKAKKEYRGKVARTLADKISIAVKVDYFKGEFIGDKLRKEVEERTK